MRSLVTVHTEIFIGVRKLIVLFASRVMTGLAFHFLVTSRKGKAGFRVEIAATALTDDVPALGGMAVGTGHVPELFPEGFRMRGLVTSLAGFLV